MLNAYKHLYFIIRCQKLANSCKENYHLNGKWWTAKAILNDWWAILGGKLISKCNYVSLPLADCNQENTHKKQINMLGSHCKEQLVKHKYVNQMKK